MVGRHPERRRVWTVAQAKARRSEVLRLAEEEGPQHIGVRRSFVVVPASTWFANTPHRRPQGAMAGRQHAPWHGPPHPWGPEITERDTVRGRHG